MMERLATQGAEPVGNTPEEFTEFLRAEIAKWAKVVKASGARVD
jgi:tripartite-type tricarboxylate transporter receptor subunit TctC